MVKMTRFRRRKRVAWVRKELIDCNMSIILSSSALVKATKRRRNRERISMEGADGEEVRSER
jgi:hypothetical protein